MPQTNKGGIGMKIDMDQMLELIRSGATAKEAAFFFQLQEARDLLADARDAMATTASCQSVAYADVVRYFNELEDDSI